MLAFKAPLAAVSDKYLGLGPKTPPLRPVVNQLRVISGAKQNLPALRCAE